MLSYLYGCVTSYEPQERLLITRRFLLALCTGMALRNLMAAFNNFSGTLHWGIPLFHNNHLGNLDLFAFFFIFPLYASSKKSFGKTLYFALLLVIFGGIVASCSRTAWLSGFSGFCVFIFLSWKFLKQNVGQCAFHKHILPTVLLLTATFFLMMLKSDSVMARIFGFQQFLNTEYWHYAFNKNFGFLGGLRLEQYHLLKNTLASHWFFGIGFIKKVVDIHGLHFVILGATGIAGFSVFCVFCVRHLIRIQEALRSEPSEELLLLLTGTFSAFAAWMVMSCMETFIVHFIVWMNVMLGVLLISLSGALKECGGQTSKELQANDRRK